MSVRFRRLLRRNVRRPSSSAAPTAMKTATSAYVPIRHRSSQRLYLQGRPRRQGVPPHFTGESAFEAAPGRGCPPTVLSVSGHDCNRRLPECHLSPVWLEDADLTVVPARLETVEGDAHPHRHRLRARLQAVGHGKRLSFEHFVVAPEESHERDERLRRLRIALVSLEVHVHLPAAA